jgi:hypothetical protein
VLKKPPNRAGQEMHTGSAICASWQGKTAGVIQQLAPVDLTLSGLYQGNQRVDDLAQALQKQGYTTMHLFDR